MALSGTVNGSVTLNSKYLSFYFTWSAVQNIEGNYSDVTVKTYWKTNNTLWNFDTVAARPASITINGITQSISKVFAIYWSSVGNPYLIQTATQRVYHNADGTKSITISARANGTASSYGPSSNISSSGDCTASATVTLNTIPRASGISATNADIGSTSIIKVNRYSTTFDHKITYSGSGISETTIVNNNEQSTISWTVPTSIFAKIPNSKYINLTIKCYTYSKSNNSLIGTSTTTMRATASEADCAPTVSGTVVDVNQNTISLTGNSNKLIRYRSTARCTISASAKNSATIVSRTINGQSISNGNSVDISNVEVSQFVFTTVDSRGYSATKTINLSMVDYIPLTISPIFTREAPTSATIFVTFTGNYFNGSFGTANNTLTIKTRYKESGTDTWTNYSTVDASNIQLVSGNSYKSSGNITVGTDCNYQKSYDVQIVATDGTSTITLSTVTVTSFVSRGIPVFDWGNDGFNVNGDFTINNSPFLPIGISNGGTGATTATTARKNLQVPYCISDGEYYGLGLPDGTTDAFFRAPKQGIIPYEIGGSGYLGTSSWPWNYIYGNTVYAPTLGWTTLWSGTLRSGSIRISNARKYAFIIVGGYPAATGENFCTMPIPPAALNTYQLTGNSASIAFNAGTPSANDLSITIAANPESGFIARVWGAVKYSA